MKETLIPILIGVFFSIGAYSGISMTERFNRPQIFWSKNGEFALNFMNLFIVLGSLGLILWAFINISWYSAIGLPILGIVFALVLINLFRLILTSAIGLISSFIAILGLHWWAWFF